MSRNRKAFTRDERKVMVVQWFAIRVQKGNEKFATMNEIAKGIGMTPSNHLLKILKEMYENKILMQKECFRPGRWRGWSFMLYPGTYTAPRARQIPLRMNGKEYGQLEMFE